MEKWRLPPEPKVYEALSAVADGRVKLTGKTAAEVTSSSLDKTYTVRWDEGFTRITSNDNASFWQGYLGYPIIAVLMETGRLSYDKDIAKHLSGIPWKKINKQFRNDYQRAVDFVLKGLEEKGIDARAVRAEAGRIMTRLMELNLEKMPRKSNLAKGGS